MQARLQRLVAGLLLAAPLVHGQGAPAAQGPKAEEQLRKEGLWFVYQEELDLATLIATCAKSLDLPIDYEPGKLQGRVTIRSGPGMTTAEMWALANRYLAKQDLACVQGAGEVALTVVPLAEAANRARTETGDLDGAPGGYVKVLRTLVRADPAKVAEGLKTLLAAKGSVVTAIPATRQVLLGGLKPQVQEALVVVDALDAARPDTTVEAVAVSHLSPTALAALVDRVQKAREKAGEQAPAGSLLANPNTASVVIVAPPAEVPTWRRLIEQFDEVETLQTAHYTPRRFGLDETARLIQEAVFTRESPEGAPRGKVVEDELTGTLIVTATWSQQEEIGDLLDRLEATPPESQRAMRAFPIKHRDVEDMLSLLRDLLDEGALLETAAPAVPAPKQAEGVGGKLPIEASALARVAPVKSEELGVTLTQDPGTNRIVAVGPPRLLDQVGALVAELDVQGPQVLVEAMIVTLTDAQTRDLGVELQKGFRWGDTLFRLQSLFGLGSPDPGLTSIPAGGGSGFSSVVLDPGSFSGVLRALETVNKGRTLTIPKVLVNNNERANLDSILQTPYTTTSLSTSTTITTFGGTLDAGTSVSVQPQITEGDKLLLDYTVSLSSFVGEAVDPSVPPPRQQTSLVSKATVPDGYAVVIGGLDVESKADSASRIPWLGRLPLVGALFQSRSESESRTRFYVFLRCSVLRNALFADLKFASKRDIEVAGVGTGAPEVRPMVMR